MTYFFSKLKNILNLDDSSRSSLSEGTAVVGGGAPVTGVLGLELGFEVAGVANGVFEVEVMVWALSLLSPAAAGARSVDGYMVFKALDCKRRSWCRKTDKDRGLGLRR